MHNNDMRVMKTIKFLAILLLSLVAIQISRASLPDKNQGKPGVPFSCRIDLGDITNATLEDVTANVNDLLLALLPTSVEEQDDIYSVTASGTKKTDGATIDFDGKISVTVSGPCKEIKAYGKEIAEMLLWKLTDGEG
jgi:hypothetical protein